jgi:antitoxin CcdA
MPDRREWDKEDAPRKPTNVTLNVALVSEARELGINLSRACERGIIDAVQRAKDERWKAENREALEYANQFVEENGIPLARFRKF